MLLYAFASPVAARGNSSQDGSERALNSPENQCSIGFQPVFCRTVKDGPRCPSGLIRIGIFPWAKLFRHFGPQSGNIPKLNCPERLALARKDRSTGEQTTGWKPMLHWFSGLANDLSKPPRSYRRAPGVTTRWRNNFKISEKMQITRRRSDAMPRSLFRSFPPSGRAGQGIELSFCASPVRDAF